MTGFHLYLIGAAIDISRTLFIYHGPPDLQTDV